jgi:hypothetical protein
MASKQATARKGELPKEQQQQLGETHIELQLVDYAAHEPVEGGAGVPLLLPLPPPHLLLLLHLHQVCTKAKAKILTKRNKISDVTVSISTLNNYPKKLYMCSFMDWKAK